MIIHRPTFGLVLLLTALAASPSHAFQNEQLAGVIRSVDLEAKKIAVTPVGKDKDVDVSVTEKTGIETSTGKALQLKDLKAGDGLGIAHSGGVASKILVNVKPDELTGHVKSVGADLTTFVVTKTGTDLDVTVGVKADTTITTTDGKKIELKELKKGDGVGIAHTNSVASKVVVNVKPAG